MSRLVGATSISMERLLVNFSQVGPLGIDTRLYGYIHQVSYGGGGGSPFSGVFLFRRHDDSVIVMLFFFLVYKHICPP